MKEIIGYVLYNKKKKQFEPTMHETKQEAMHYKLVHKKMDCEVTSVW